MFLKNNFQRVGDLAFAVVVCIGKQQQRKKVWGGIGKVAAAVGLAGVGAKKTQLEIWADPGLSKNTHTILVKSDSSNFKIEIENIQSIENPGTGKITALSVIATLRGIISSLKVGT